MAAIFSGPGIAIATALHTFGAIGYLAGIAFWIGWHRSLRRGHDHPQTLALGAATTYVSIMANLAGGFIKTYIPGHPGLSSIASEPWVLNMTLKHVVLFAGMFAAIWLFEIEGPRMRRAFKAGTLESIPVRRSSWLSTVVVLSILVAAVQGGAATVMDIGGATPDGPSTPGATSPEPFEAGPYNFNGRLTSDPRGASSSGEFAVPDGATRIIADFAATPLPNVPLNPNQFTLVLRDPTGASTSLSTDPQDPATPRSIHMELEDVFPGTWSYDVQADAAIQADWTLDIELEYGVVEEGQVIVPLGSFYEINLEMPDGARLSWDWSSTGHVDWNVHTHFDGVTDYVEQGHAASHVGAYTTQRAGMHSIMWSAVEGEVTLDYKIWGDFTVHSTAGP